MNVGYIITITFIGEAEMCCNVIMCCIQGRLYLSTDGDKCAMVSLGGDQLKVYIKL